MKVRVEIENLEELKRALANVENGMKDVLAKAVLAGAEYVEREANADGPGPNNKHELRKNLKTKAEAAIGPDKKHWYYKYVETGAQAHTVTPKDAQALQIYGVGFYASARPGGFAARPFLRPIIDTKGSQIQEEMAKEFRKVLP